MTFSTEVLRDRYLALSKKIHPDRFTINSPREALYASRWSRAANQAHAQLKEKRLRAEAILKAHGKDDLLKKGSVPTELAEDYFDFQDLVSEGGKDFSEFLQRLNKYRDDIAAKWAQIGQANTLEGKALENLARLLTLERYIDSMENDIKRRSELRPEVGN